jgi:MSHA biogenesis protein MshJ
MKKLLQHPRYLALCAKIDALQKREQLIVLLVALAMTYALVQVLVLDPLLQEHDRLDRNINSSQRQIETLEQERLVIDASIKAGPNRVQEKELQTLEQKMAALDRALEESTVALIPPTLMPAVMQEVLAEIKGLKLLSLENRVAIPLVAPENPDTEMQAENQKQDDDYPKEGNLLRSSSQQQASLGAALFRHSFVLIMEGDYAATLAFFQALEGKQWKFYWQDLRYEVTKYPKAKIVLEVYTLSTERDWIGV